MIVKYRKKPVVIEAVKWLGTNVVEMENFLKAPLVRDIDHNLVIPTLEGNMIAIIGDWIIKGIKGEFYPCKPEIFRASYEPVIEEENAKH